MIQHLRTPNNSRPGKICVDNFEHTVLVSTEFFTVYHWKINDRVAFDKFAPYLLVSVILGKGKIILDSVQCSLKKGQHFIVPNTVDSWAIEGEIEMIVSHI